MNHLIAFDNEGETFDRFTILNKKDGDMIAASEMPFNPLGFGQFCGNVADNYWHVAYGAGWRRGIDNRLLNKRIKFAVNHFLNDCEHIGKIVEIETLPNDVQKFIKQSFD